jgi:hypothetical protein
VTERASGPAVSPRAWGIPLLLAASVAGVGLWADSVARGVVEGRVHDQLRLASDVHAVSRPSVAGEATAAKVRHAGSE